MSVMLVAVCDTKQACESKKQACLTSRGPYSVIRSCGKKKQLDALISQIYFWNKTLHVSDSLSVHHQESSTVHTVMVYVIQVMLAARKWLFLLQQHN